MNGGRENTFRVPVLYAWNTPTASLRFGTPERHSCTPERLSNETLRMPCSTALQRQLQCVLCGAYVGFIERMGQTVCVDGVPETVAEGEC